MPCPCLRIYGGNKGRYNQNRLRESTQKKVRERERDELIDNPPQRAAASGENPSSADAGALANLSFDSAGNPIYLLLLLYAHDRASNRLQGLPGIQRHLGQ